MSDVDYRPIETTPTDTSPASLADQLPPLETEVRAQYDGEYRESHPDAHSAAKEWGRRRREIAEATGEPTEPIIDELKYIDGRAPDAEVSAKQAADDINTYRAQKAAQLLQEMAGEAPEQQQAAAEQQQPEQPAAVTPQQIAEEFHAKASPQLKAAIEHEIAAIHQQTSQQWQAAENAKENYLTAINALAANAQGINVAEFGDIRTHAVRQLALCSTRRLMGCSFEMVRHRRCAGASLARINADHESNGATEIH
jgi:hypothetical protein